MRRFQFVGRVVGLLVVLLLARVASATPITYDEGVSGDLGESFPATLFMLDAGSNTIAGTTHFDPFGANDADFDQLAFVVPLGMHVNNITYAFQPTIGPGTIQAGTQYALGHGNAAPFPAFPLFGDLTVDLFGTSQLHPFGSVLPLEAGTYAVQQYGMVVGGLLQPGWSTNYTWTMDVVSDAAVPEPASLSLLGAGLAGVWMRQRRRMRPHVDSLSGTRFSQPSRMPTRS